MDQEWNDDERDTSFVSTKAKQNDLKYKSVCEVMRDYYNDQKESQYSWSINEYTKELKKRINRNVKASIPIVKRQDDDESDYQCQIDFEQEHDEEVNTEIMENEIYKKSLYS